MAQGPYAIPQLRYDAIAVITNTAPIGAFRGAGRPEATALLERLLDLAADELGIAPEEIRRRNLLAPDAFPYRDAHRRRPTTSATTSWPSSEALRLADVDGAARRAAAPPRGRRPPAARASGSRPTSRSPASAAPSSAACTINADGTATVMAGTSAHGQGHATSFSMIVADRLGIPMDQITYVQSDTAVVRSGGGTGGSRSLQLGGSAVSAAAARRARAGGRGSRRRCWRSTPADIEPRRRGFGVRRRPRRPVSLGRPRRPRGRERGRRCAPTSTSPQNGATFPFGAHVAIVEVDTETGKVTPLRHVAVDDCGRVLNPLIVDGQQHGGAVQGISQALWEEFVYDADGPAADLDLRRLPDADRGRHDPARDLHHRDPDRPQPARRQGHRRVRHDRVHARPSRTRWSTRSATSASGTSTCRAPRSGSGPRSGRRAAGTAPDPWRDPPAAFADARARGGRGRGGGRGLSLARLPRLGGCPPRPRRRDRRPRDAVRRQDRRRRPDLTVERGTITAVLGPNGAGKTTTLETCEGYRRPQEGTVRVLGLDPVRDRARPAAADRRDAPGRRRLVRRPRDGDAAPRRRAARPPARRRDARRAARARATAGGRRTAGSPAASSSGSAWRWRWSGARSWCSSTSRPPAWTRRPGVRRGSCSSRAARRRRHRRADHALHGRGRAPRRPHPHHRPRPADRLGHAAGAHPRRHASRRSGWSSPSRSRPSAPTSLAGRARRRHRGDRDQRRTAC